jgi:hypothetical protein
VFEIIFKPISSAEMSELPKMLQLEILDEFNVLTPDFLEKNPNRFSVIKKGKRMLYRYRAKDYRIYFERAEKGFIIHRVLSKNTLEDFLFRSKLSKPKEENFEDDPKFWELIDDKASK